MLTKLHFAVTVLLLAAALAFAGLWYKGRVTPGAEMTEKADPPEETGGRYRIEKLDDLRKVLNGAGKLDFFGPQLFDAWAFKYSGGHLQVFLETDYNGSVAPSEQLPADWPSLLASSDGLKENQAAAFRKEGYVLLVAMPAVMTLEESFYLYGPQLGGVLSCGLAGPLHAMLPLHAPVHHKRPYRLYLSGGPLSGESGSGFSLWAEHLLPITGPVVARSHESEDSHVGGGKNLPVGKDITLLDRARGHSRIRLKARFLGDGEIREMSSKTGS